MECGNFADIYTSIQSYWIRMMTRTIAYCLMILLQKFIDVTRPLNVSTNPSTFLPLSLWVLFCIYFICDADISIGEINSTPNPIANTGIFGEFNVNQIKWLHLLLFNISLPTLHIKTCLQKLNVNKTLNYFCSIVLLLLLRYFKWCILVVKETRYNVEMRKRYVNSFMRT